MEIQVAIEITMRCLVDEGEDALVAAARAAARPAFSAALRALRSWRAFVAVTRAAEGCGAGAGGAEVRGAAGRAVPGAPVVIVAVAHRAHHPHPLQSGILQSVQAGLQQGGCGVGDCIVEVVAAAGGERGEGEERGGEQLNL